MSRGGYLSYKNLILATFDARKVYNNELLLDRIQEQADPYTPKRTGDLRFYVKKYSTGDHGDITWTMKYSAYQERGSNPDGSRPVRNYTTPGTGPWYAKNAVNDVFQNKFADIWETTANAIPGPQR